MRVKKPKKKRPLLPRRSWVINPVTRVKESEKKYSRGKTKMSFKKELDES